VLVAEVDGSLWAALSLDSGAVVADPFRPSMELRSLLALRAAQIGAARAFERRRGLVRPRARRALQASLAMPLLRSVRSGASGDTDPRC
jgi:hypothetical protein